MTLDYPKETGQYSKAEEYVPTETAIGANGDIYAVVFVLTQETKTTRY
jgi:peptidylamidoglycolate lyase